MKEFEEMQKIWNSQSNEDSFTIDEPALHAQIMRKSRSTNRAIQWFEWIMIGLNLGVGILLTVDAIVDGDQLLQFFMPAAYFGYFVFALARRLARRREEVHFDPTMLGELDKAIWRVDYLIQQSRSMVYWYILPLTLFFTVFAFFNDKVLLALGLMLVLVPVTFLGSRWEINKFYLPKKRALENLRQKLIAS